MYSIMYYAAEALVRALIAVVDRLLRYFSKPAPEERRGAPPMFEPIAYRTTLGDGSRAISFYPRYTAVRVDIPLIGFDAGDIGVEVREGPPPMRLYFTYAEAASKGWFRDIEWLAREAERRAREGSS